MNQIVPRIRVRTRLMTCAALVVILGGFMPSLPLQAQSRSDDSQEYDFKPQTVLQPLRPIVDAPFIAADKVKDQVRENELVLGVFLNGQARAYPINMLTGPLREIINDRVGGTPLAATW